MSIKKKFFNFEKENSLFSIEINGIPIWERLRFGLFRKIEQSNDKGQAHTSVDLSTTNQLTGAKLWLKNLFYRNPYLTKQSDFLFFGHPRRKKRPDGYWWDIYCDPIHEHGKLDSIHFERPYLLRHRTPAKTEIIRYIEFIIYSGTIQRKLGLRNVSFSYGEKKLLKNVEDEIESIFDMRFDITGIVKRILLNRKCRLWLYKKLLRKVDPRVAVILVSYGSKKKTFTEACKKEGIPVVELQHGTIHPGHLGYTFPNGQPKTVFPDYLLTWGNFWKKNASFPIPDRRILPVGFPYIEMMSKKHKKVKSKKQILFVSQGLIGKALSQFALEVNKHRDIDHKLVYKLHPGEYDRWRDEYPQLVNADIEVIDSSEPSLYHLFAESSIQIGIGSTAVYEGLAFGLETFVYDYAGSEVLSSLIKANSAKLVTSSDELAELIGQRADSFNRDSYFAPNALEQVTLTLQNLADKGTQD